jgi:hypothetical protein
MVKDEGEAELLITEGFAVVAEPNVTALRLPVYAVFSVQPAWDANVSPAAKVVPEPGPVTKPMYHVTVCALPARYAPFILARP